MGWKICYFIFDFLFSPTASPSWFIYPLDLFFFLFERTIATPSSSTFVFTGWRRSSTVAQCRLPTSNSSTDCEVATTIHMQRTKPKMFAYHRSNTSRSSSCNREMKWTSERESWNNLSGSESVQAFEYALPYLAEKQNDLFSFLFDDTI